MMGNFSDDATAVLRVLGSASVIYKPMLARILGSVNAAIWLGQLLYWDGKQNDPNGWIHKTAAEFEEETALSERQHEGARELCVSLGVVEYKRMGIPALPNYKVNTVKLIKVISDYVSGGGDKNKLGQNVLTGKDISPSDLLGQNVLSDTEITTEITTLELGTGDQIAVPGNVDSIQNEPTPVIPISESESGGTDMADATTIAKADAVLLAFASKDKSDRSILRQRMSDNGKALMTEFHAFTGLPWMRTWNSAANEMDGLGVRPDHVKAACVRLKTSGMTVVDLHSVKKTAIAVMADARSGKANGGSGVHTNGHAVAPLLGMAAGEHITGYQRASDGSMIPIIQSKNGGVNGAGSSSIH